MSQKNKPAPARTASEAIRTSPAAGFSLRPTPETLSWMLLLGLIACAALTHLIVPLIAGLTLFTLGERSGAWIESKGWASGHRSRAVGVFGSVGLAGAVLGGFVAWLAILLLDGGAVSLAQLLSESLDKVRELLPASVAASLPANTQALVDLGKSWLSEHAGEMGKIGTHAATGAAHILLAMVAGGFGALAGVEARSASASRKPLAQALVDRGTRFMAAFDGVVLSQAKISAISAAMSAVFLFVLLPLFGKSIPQSGALVLLTFVCGLIPVVGNLISNTAVALAALTVSPAIAGVALGYLLAAHKLEYFINAKIVGDSLGAKDWELLSVMLLSEALMGLPGMILGPVVYAWIKRECKELGWL